MHTNPSQPAKPRFYDVCNRYEQLDSPTLEEIAEKAGVGKHVMENMYIHMAVRRADAEKLLATFSQHVGQPYTLDNVRVALLPTFQEVCATHHWDFAMLTEHTEVPYSTIQQLLADEPVPIEEARVVLQMASRLSGKDYTLDTVDVTLVEGGES